MPSTWYWIRRGGDEMDRITPNAGRAEAESRKGARVTAVTAPTADASIDALLSR